ncbi:MAG: hypothetical protein ABTQ34_06000 [Bdellovibrionales bacterium]
MSGNYLAPTVLAAMSTPHQTSDIMHVVVFHDNWCGVYKNKPCNCNPDIKILSEAEYQKRFGKHHPKL